MDSRNSGGDPLANKFVEQRRRCRDDAVEIELHAFGISRWQQQADRIGEFNRHGRINRHAAT